MELSVFIVASHTLELFQKCIESVLSVLPPGSEVLVILNGPQPEKSTWLENLSDSRIQYFESATRPVSFQRNRAFELSNGKLIYFLDDDVIVQKGLFEMAIRCFTATPELAVLGGPNLTPPESSYTEKLYGAVLTSFFAAPFVYARYTPVKRLNGKQTNDLRLILCNLVVRKEAVPLSLRFSEKLWPNEENLFLYKAQQLGLRLQYSSDLSVLHHRRISLRSFYEQIRRYGRGRGKQILLCWQSTPLKLVVVGFLGFFCLLQSIEWFAGLYLIGSFLGWCCSKEARKMGVVGFLVAPLLTFLVHISYLMGLFGYLIFGQRSSKYSVFGASPGR